MRHRSVAAMSPILTPNPSIPWQWKGVGSASPEAGSAGLTQPPARIRPLRAASSGLRPGRGRSSAGAEAIKTSGGRRESQGPSRSEGKRLSKRMGVGVDQLPPCGVPNFL